MPMKIRSLALILWAVCSTVVAGPVMASDTTDSRETRGLPLDRGLGQRVDNVALTALDGGTTSLYSLANTSDLLVVVFTGIDCPVGNLYLQTLNEIAETYAERNVTVIGINSNASESLDQLAAHAEEYDVRFPIYRDDDALAADLLLAEKTCEVVILQNQPESRPIPRRRGGPGEELQIRYRGAIDDQFVLSDRTARKAEPTVTYLKDALNDLLTGVEPRRASTPVSGCPIERGEATRVLKILGQRVRGLPDEYLAELDESEPEIQVGDVTYYRDVTPIVQAKCQNCHRPNAVAPFTLTSLKDMQRWSAVVEEVLLDRRMPPWHAAPSHLEFANDRSLSPTERATLLSWLENGMEPGDPAHQVVNAPRTRNDWTIGQPDIVIPIPRDYTVSRQGTLDYVHFWVPLNFDQDVWVQAAECRPTEPTVVHHIIAYLYYQNEEGQWRREHFSGFAPGEMPTVLPKGTAKKIPANSLLQFELHYTPTGKSVVDRSELGLVLARDPITRQAFTDGIANPRFRIPPGDDNYEVVSEFTAPRDLKLLSFMPHMHLRGKDFTYFLISPEGDRETLLYVPRYDFAWQSYYTLKTPLDLPAGSTIECIAHFDNSTANPYLTEEQTERYVTWGEQTSDEMMIGYIDYLVDIPEVVPQRPDLSKPVTRPLEDLKLPNRAGE